MYFPVFLNLCVVFADPFFFQVFKFQTRRSKTKGTSFCNSKFFQISKFCDHKYHCNEQQTTNLLLTCRRTTNFFFSFLRTTVPVFHSNSYVINRYTHQHHLAGVNSPDNSPPFSCSIEPIFQCISHAANAT